MRKMTKALALFLAVTMVVGMTACGKKEGNEPGNTDKKPANDKTLVIGTQTFNGVFSPLFYNSAYDAQVLDMVFTSVCRLNADGELIDEAGHVELKEEGGKYVYTVTIKKDLKWSDGEPVTIDDLIFTYYAMADPSYDGMSTFNTLDIDGLAAYVNSEKHLYALMGEAGKENTDFSKWDQETQTAFWADLETAGTKFAQEIVDYMVAETAESESPIAADDVVTAAANWGFTLAEGATATDFFWAIYEAYGGDLNAINDESAGSTMDQLLDAKYYEMVELSDVNEITGIVKKDDYTVEVTFNSPNIIGDRQVAWQTMMPKHYYGKDFKKGDLSSVKALNNAPMGCGPYVFESYANNIVTLRANENYFKGTPKIGTVKFQVVNEQDKVDQILTGAIDITDPSASLEIVEQMKEHEDTAGYTLVDNPGYGYIAINAERVSDLNVRKGLMHLMNRGPAIESYYGELGKVIERPMTPTIAEYPDDAKEYYGYDKTKALEYFKAAGYEQVDGKLVKDGQQLMITVGVGDLKSHPSGPILTQMASDMSDMGAVLNVNDMDSSVLFDAMDKGTLDMWVAAWGNATDCDQTQMFSSKGGSNRQRYGSDELDAVLEEITRTLDFDKRCELVAKSLDMIMDAAVYMPVYQRKNMEIYNVTTLNVDTLPKETTTYYNYVAEIHTLEMK